MNGKIVAIVNADDFGANEAQTLAIGEAFRLGLLSRTTAMTNMPWFEKATDLAREEGFFGKVGLHFNLTEGCALTEVMRKCSFFCDAHGCFTGNFHRSMKSRLLLPRFCKEVVAEEARAQMQRYVDAGYTLMHLDSHHHVHTDFSIAQILLPIARQFGFKTCRLSRTISRGRMGMAKRIYKVAFNRYVRHYMRVDVDEFTDFPVFSECFSRLRRPCRVEIMVHPGLSGDTSVEHQCDFWHSVDDKGVEVYDD